MSIIVLRHTAWEATRALAEAVGATAGARVVPFDRRPELAMYEVVVVATPLWAIADPRLLPFVARELRGKPLAWVTDGVGPIAEKLCAPLSMVATTVGGARVYAPSLHAFPGLLGEYKTASREAAVSWAERLLEAYPAPTFPRGDAGRRAERL